jgi:hypothetical protein
VVDRHHAGILVAVQKKGFAQADWVPVLQQKLVTAEELAGHMYRWQPYKREWSEDPWRPEE